MAGKTCTSGALLAYEDATCGAWANLFHNLLLVQGITNSKQIAVEFKNKSLNSTEEGQFKSAFNSFFGSGPIIYDHSPLQLPDGSIGTEYFWWFFVKKWGFSSSIPFYFSEFSPPMSIPVVNNNNMLNYVEEDGIEGQGNMDPRSTFKNHAINQYKLNQDQFFDPSYGSPPVGESSWKSSSLAGKGTVFILKRTFPGGSPSVMSAQWVNSLSNFNNIEFK